jgi:hypothetical protein
MQQLLSFLGSPHHQAVSFIFAAAAAGELLIAIWAAKSRGHWFWRALIVWTAVMALAPIRAFEPAMTFAVALPITALLVMAQRRRDKTRQTELPRESRPHPIRFTMRDLLLFTAIVGLSIAGLLHLARNIHRPMLTNYVLNISALTAVALIAFNAVFARRRLFWLCLLTITIAAFAFAVPSLGSTPESYDALLLLDVGFHPTLLLASASNLALLLTESALLLIAAIWLTNTASGKRNVFARITLAALAVLLAAPLAPVYWHLLWLSPLSPPFSTGPNNYDRLFEIAQQVESLAGIRGATTPGSPAYTQRTALIDEAVALAGGTNWVPADPDPNFNRVNLDEYIARGTRKFRTLSRAIEDVAGAAYTRGDPAAALALRLANIRLGVMLQRGSEEPVYLIGRAVEGVSLEQLVRIRHEFTPDQIKTVIAALQRDLDEREPPETVVARDKAISQRAYGWGSHLDYVLERYGLGSDIYPAFLLVTRERPHLLRLFQTDLAIRLYQQQRGTLPSSLDQLVPDFIRAIPIDLHSGKPLVYRRLASDFLLYSLGQDGVDNGGNFTNFASYATGIDQGDHTHFGVRYDFDLDTLIRP